MTDNTPRPVTATELRRAARNHADAVTSLHHATMRVAQTTAKLAEMLERGKGYALETGPLYKKADDAMGVIGKAYEQVAAIFDNLEEDNQ